jgi:hypothetical protein
MSSDLCKKLSLVIIYFLFSGFSLFSEGAYSQFQDWEYNPTVILALSLARSGDLIPQADMKLLGP